MSASNPEKQHISRLHGAHPGKERSGYPRWWTPAHTSAWDRSKEAFRRDWEQTKHDVSFGKAGIDLDQDVTDTVKQAAGKEPIPPGGVPNEDEEFARLEPAFRFGYGARLFYVDDPEWNEALETKLRSDWTTFSNERWEASNDAVRRGFEFDE
jgi:hypothetical protein